MSVETTNAERLKLALRILAETAAGLDVLMEAEARRLAEAARPSGQAEFEERYFRALSGLRERQQLALEAMWTDEMQVLTGQRCPQVWDEAMRHRQQ